MQFARTLSVGGSGLRLAPAFRQLLGLGHRNHRRTVVARRIAPEQRGRGSVFRNFRQKFRWFFSCPKKIGTLVAYICSQCPNNFHKLLFLAFNIAAFRLQYFHMHESKGEILRQDRRDRFVRLAEARVSKALQAIRVVGNLSNRSNYDYSDEDVRKITRALSVEVTALESRFRSVDSKVRPEFRLG